MTNTTKAPSDLAAAIQQLTKNADLRWHQERRTGYNLALAAAAALVEAAPQQKLQDSEQYRMQMAGICTAAIGYWKEGESIHPDYDTVALRDVAKLYAKYAALYEAAQAKQGEAAPLAARDFEYDKARATPAQPVPMESQAMAIVREFVQVSEEHDVGGGDLVVTTCEVLEKAKALIAGLRDPSLGVCGAKPSDCPDNARCGCKVSAPSPSPSSVGDAIRAMPLPETELTTKIGMFEVRAWTKSHIGDILHAAAEIAEKAMPQKSAVEKMLEINQLDELGHEVARLQRALCFWLPRVVDCDGEVAERIFQDAFLLDGIDGNIPDDFKTAQELGWITLSEAAALAEQVQANNTKDE